MAAIQAAAGGALPMSNGTAGALQALLADLASLCAGPGSNGALPLPAAPRLGGARSGTARPAAPQQAQQQHLVLEVGAGDAGLIREAVVQAAGPPARGILRHLAGVVAAVKTGGVKVRFSKPDSTHQCFQSSSL